MGRITTDWSRFTRSRGRRIEADFDGGEISSDAGLLLLRELSRKLGLRRRAAAMHRNRRQRGKVAHHGEAMLRQRVSALCAGWAVHPPLPTIPRQCFAVPPLTKT